MNPLETFADWLGIEGGTPAKPKERDNGQTEERRASAEKTRAPAPVKRSKRNTVSNATPETNADDGKTDDGGGDSDDDDESTDEKG